MYRINRTARILLAMLLGTLLDSGLAIAASGADPLRVSGPTIAALASLHQPEAIKGAVDSDGDGIADSSSEIGLAAAAAASSASAKDVPACGAAGQRACCVFERWPLQNCEDGKAEIPGCFGDCLCTNTDPQFPQYALGTCVDVTPCGGEGQRTCVATEKGIFTAECENGLTALPGCSGDCFAKGLGSSWGLSTKTCARLFINSEGFNSLIDEPDTNADLTGATTSCSMSGYADMHLHLFADLAHGGGVLAGKPYDPDHGVNTALEQDFTSAKSLIKGRTDEAVTVNPAGCPGWLLDSTCDRSFFHGDHDIFVGDTLGAGTRDGAGSNLGAPLFNGWPKWTSTTHQQAYYRWLKRAWQGGLRLTTMLAVTNEALCKTGKRDENVKYTTPDDTDPNTVGCDDSMASIKAQIDAAKTFETWIANYDGGWFKIAYTPFDARKIMAQGKLAVVLGVETAELFNCKFPIDQCTLQKNPENMSDAGFLYSCADPFSRDTNSRLEPRECTAQSIKDDVQALYDMGVRHVFPIHNFDNAFGGAATWNNAIEVGNRIAEDHWWSTRDCSDEGYGFALGGLFNAWYKSFLVHVGDGTLTGGPNHSEKASCNFFGLFPQGRLLIEELMKKGMIIDVDHMSAYAFNDTLEMAENAATLEDPVGTRVLPGRTTRYPVVASHVQSRDMHHGAIVHERMRTKDQLLKIKGVQGMIAAMLKDDQQDTDYKGQNFMNPYGAVNNDCRHSSKSFATAYQYAVDTMEGSVAFGSDFNGVAGHVGPRFGSEACGGSPEAEAFPAQATERQIERSAQYIRGQWLPDPFILQDPGTNHTFGAFSHQKTGLKTFDYNRDGLAHVGLLPDFVADLKNVGLPDYAYRQIFRSAEEYIKVWERSTGDESLSDTCEFFSDPNIAFDATPAATKEGLETVFTFTTRRGFDVEVACGPSNAVLSQRVQKISEGSLESTYQAVCEWKHDWIPGQDHIGTLNVTATFASTGRTVSVSVPVNPGDAPTVVCFPDPNWYSDNANVECRANVGGPQPTQTFVLHTNVPDGTETTTAITDTHQVCNAADICANVGPIAGLKVDRKAPTITCNAPSDAWSGTDAIINCTAIDGGAGVLPDLQQFSLVTTVSSGMETANAFTDSRTVCDNANHCATVGPIGGNKVDKKAPTLSCQEADGLWHPGNVSLNCHAMDGGSGVVNPNFSLFTAVGSNTETTDAQTNTREVCDNAGNCATAGPIGRNKVDKKAPSVSCAAPDGLWHAADVTIGCGAGDGGSGLASAADTSFALVTSVAPGTETANALTSGRTVCDAVDNCVNAGPVVGNKVDKKPPLIVVSRTPPPNENGWNNTDVVATFAATDGGSGVNGAATLTVPFTAEGANQSATRTFTDNVGNTASAVIDHINIDKTPPTLTCSNDSPTLWPPDRQLVTVTTSVAVDGGLSGAAGFTLLSATSSQPDTGIGDATAGDIQSWTIGTPDTSGLLRAERSDAGTGRIYTLTYRGLDLAGNGGMCTTTVSVPRSPGGGNQ